MAEKTKNFEQYLESIVEEYDIKYKSKKTYGWNIREQIKIIILSKKIVEDLANEYGDLLIIGREEDFSYWEKIVKKINNPRIKLEAWPDKYFSGYRVDYPINDLKKQVEHIGQKLILIVAETNASILEMLILDWGKRCRDIIDEFYYLGVDLKDPGWKNRLFPNCFKLTFKNHILWLYKKKHFKNKISMKFGDYFEILMSEYEGVEDIFYFRMQLKNAESTSRKNYYLRRMIWAACSLYDFNLIDEILKEYDQEKIYFDFLTKLHNLEEMVNREIANRSKRDIIIHWIDAVPKSDLDNWSGFDKIRSKSFEFNNTISMVSYTHPTFQLILHGGNYIDDGLWKYNRNPMESNLLKVCKDNNYHFYSESTTFDKSLDDKALRKIKTRGRYSDLPLSLTLWHSKMRIIDSEKPCVIFIHTIQETHSPMFYAGMEKVWIPLEENLSDPSFENNRKSAFKYAEKQLLEFQNVLNENATTIYMSDHGRPDASWIQWKKDRNHSFCFIYGKDIPVKTTGKFFQHNNFYKIIQMIMDKNYAFEDVTAEFAVIQAEDFYSAGFCDKLLKNDISWYRCVQFRGVVTGNYKLVKYPMKSLYFLMPDEQLVDEKEIEKETRERLNEWAGEKFIDIFSDNRYCYTVQTYKKIGLIDEQNNWTLPEKL